jgi:hypothetical protein
MERGVVVGLLMAASLHDSGFFKPDVIGREEGGAVYLLEPAVAMAE